MKTILCFGDSNTWGYDPANKGGNEPRIRFGVHERWPGVMRDALGDDFWVVEEGLNGRTTVWPDPIEGEYKSGKSTLMAILDTHHPLDLIVLMLGTNDLKMRFSVTPRDVATGAMTLLEMIKHSEFGRDFGAPKVLLIAPAPLTRLSERMAAMFVGGTEKSLELDRWYRQAADQFGVDYMNAAELVACSDVDGIHLDVAGHARLGQAVAARVREILG